MIALIARSIPDARAIIMAEMPNARVWHNGRVRIFGREGDEADALIVTREDHIRGLELSGFIMLDPDAVAGKVVPWQSLLARVRAPIRRTVRRKIVAPTPDETA